MKKTGKSEHLHRSDRPKKIDTITAADIQILVEDKTATSASKIKEVVNSLHTGPISTATVQHYLHEIGY